MLYGRAHVNLVEYSSHDGVGLAQLIRAGEVAEREVLDVAHQAIESVNGEINAVIEVYSPSSVDCGVGVSPAAPFRGVPSLRKDIHDEAGRRVEFGSALGVGHVASQDGAVIRRMKEAGVVFIGRSATSEMALFGTTETTVFGATRNPYDLTRSVGGSSGGAAAAVAAGVVPFADASDAGGSIRIPASCCGLVGLKSSRSVVAVGRTKSDLNENVQLVVARSVRDVAVMASTIDDMVASQTEPWRPGISPLQIAISNRPWPPRTTVDAEIVAAVDDVAAVLASLNCAPEHVSPLDVAEDYWAAILTRLVSGVYDECKLLARATGREVTEELLEPMTWMYYEEGRRSKPGDITRALEARNRVVHTVDHFFSHYDVLVTPTLQELPPLLGTAGGHACASTPLEHLLLAESVSPNLAIFNMTGNPAVSVPTAMSANGLPIGVHLVGRRGSDHMLLALARELEKQRPWNDRRPAIHVANH